MQPPQLRQFRHFTEIETRPAVPQDKAVSAAISPSAPGKVVRFEGTHSGDGDVGRVRFGLGRNQPAGQQRPSQFLGFLRIRQDLAGLQFGKTLLGCSRVATLDLFHHQDGNKQVAAYGNGTTR